MRNILFFGDNLTAWYGLAYASNDACPVLIQQKINGLLRDKRSLSGPNLVQDLRPSI